MTIQSGLKWAEQKLPNKNSSALLDAAMLLSFVLKRPKEFLWTHPEKILNKNQWRRFRELIQRRARREPLAYLTERREFYGLDFRITPAALIPRPETELLVDCFKDEWTKRPGGNWIVIDAGTGCGCIPIAILKTVKRLNKKTIEFYGTDISPAALRLARQNARRHGVKIKFRAGHLLTPVLKEMAKLPQSKIIITANLPYLTTRQWKNCPPDVRCFEPRSALDGGVDGLKHYRALFEQIKKTRCLVGPTAFSLFLEIDPSQTRLIKKMAGKCFPETKLEIKKDLAGRNRVLFIKSGRKRRPRPALQSMSFRR